jgi:hypothetical protein
MHWRWKCVARNRGQVKYLCTYDLYSPVHNVLDACTSITLGEVGGVGPWNSRAFWAL